MKRFISLHSPTQEGIDKYVKKGYKVISLHPAITVLEWDKEPTEFKFLDLSKTAQKQAISNTKKFYPESYPKLEKGLTYSAECVVEDIEENKLKFNKKGEIIK